MSLVDLEVRYANIKKQNPKVKNCSVKGCSNPRDSTPLLGEDTCCAYHRLLFDFWSADILHGFDKSMKYLENQKARRRAFTIWRNKIGKKTCDEIVMRMMREPVNWEC